MPENERKNPNMLVFFIHSLHSVSIPAEYKISLSIPVNKGGLRANTGFRSIYEDSQGGAHRGFTQ